MGAYQEVTTGYVPLGNNPRAWIARQQDILGGFHQYNTLEEFITNLHPDKMIVGMKIIINQHDRTGGKFPSKEFNLLTKPAVSDYPLSLTPIDSNYYLKFWEISKEFAVNEAGVYEIQYAGDINGVKPGYPYLSYPADEGAWSGTYDPTYSKWYRERRSDEIDIGTGIYLYWTAARSINGNFTTGDYIANLFIRAFSTPPLPARYDTDGSLNNDPAGWSDVPTGTLGTNGPLYEIRAQKDQYGSLKTDWLGPFLIPEDEDVVRYNSQSTPNPNTFPLTGTAYNPLTEVANDGVGGEPAGTNYDTDLTTAGWIEAFNPSLHNYRAQRIENAPNDYSSWVITKIAEESGEYIDRIYKLFPSNTIFDNQTFINDNTPTGSNPIENSELATENVGWSDVPLLDTDTHINCMSEAKKFFDGSLKTTWTSPKNSSGVSVYDAYIKSDGQNVFKYDSPGGLVSPATITLTARLFKGLTEITTNLTYAWHKVYNNKIIIAEGAPIATTQAIVVSPADVSTKAIYKCYITLPTGATALVFSEEEAIVDITDGDDAKSLALASDTPIITYNSVGPSGTDIVSFADSAYTPGVQTTVTTTAAHLMTNGAIVTIATGGGAGTFNGTYTISDVTEFTFDIIFVFATTDTADYTSTMFPVETVFLRGRQNFLDAITFYWYKYNGVAWVALTNGVNGYTLTNQTLQINTVDLFASNGNQETARFALSTAALPANVEDVDEFFDITTVTKLSSIGVGAAGVDAVSIILSNELDSVILDRATLSPQTTPILEIGTTGRVKTLIKIYDGPIKLDYTTNWTITSIVSDTANVTFGHQTDGGTDREIYIATWTSIIARKVNGTITMDVGGIEYIKNFTVSSNLDDAGALIAYLKVNPSTTNTSLAFTPSNRNDIRLQAVLNQDETIIPVTAWNGITQWFYGTAVAGGAATSSGNIIGGSPALDLKTITRAEFTGSMSVYAKITYDGRVFVTTPINIDDILDAKQYRVYYNYAAAYDVDANEPLAVPGIPDGDGTPTSVFDAQFPSTGATSQWYRRPQSKTYFVCDGEVDINDTIIWGTAYRVKGEKGVQGDVSTVPGPTGIAIDGKYTDLRFKNAASQPTTPLDAGASGWAAFVTTPPAGQFTWMIVGIKNANGTLESGVWGTPGNISGPEGDKGDLGDPGTSVTVTFSASPPGSPIQGDIWIQPA
jgi:hypothetical protein